MTESQGLTIPRCSVCWMHQPLCICMLVGPFKTRTRLVAVSHQKELGRNSNSARLIPLCLTDGHMVIRGRRDDVVDANSVAPTGFRHLVLFPAEDAVPLNTVSMTNEPINLIIPDGNWGQARRMLRRESILADLPRVSLPPGPPSEFRLRRQKDIRHVSTCEAAARALGCLDEPDAQRHLEEVFRIMVERTLWSRGELAASNVTGGIPTEAFHPVLSPRDKMKST